MDITASAICKECFIKEKRFMKRWEKENRQRCIEEGREYEPDTTAVASYVTPRGPSAAQHFLDQTLNLNLPRSAGEQPEDHFIHLLGSGVSKEGKGKVAYLKARATLGPQEKEGRATTSSQEVGWTAPTITTSGSPFAHKPIIRESFFRSNGVFTSKHP